MTYVLSDIHGNINAFHSILNQINIKQEDKLYILGDVIDKLPYGIEVLKEIMDMKNAYMLLGNHEYMMMGALGFCYDSCYRKKEYIERFKELWHNNGGDMTYKAWNNLSNIEQNRIMDYLKSLPLNYNIDVCGKIYKLVHAAPEELYEALGNFDNETKAEYCVWSRDDIMVMSKVKNITTIFGHTPTAYFQKNNPLSIFRYETLIGIDCGAYLTKDRKNSKVMGRLACLRLDDDKEFYSEV